MCFGKVLYRVINCILAAPPKIGTAFFNKVDLADAYMRIWFRLEDIPLVEFLVPKATPNEEKLVGLHLSIPMGYMESAAFFCATTETVKDRTLDTLSMRHTAPPHHLGYLADTKPPQTSEEEARETLDANRNWEALSSHARETAIAHVKVYLDDFIGITQGGPTERRKMTRHLFCTIDKLFQPNNKDDIAREEPIYLKNPCKGDAAWSTQKVVLSWGIDTVKQVLNLPENCKTNLLSLLKTIPPSAR